MKQYYVVIWGDNARLSYPSENEQEAGESSYGLKTSDMEVIPAGTSQKQALKKYEQTMKERKLSGC